ncbi:hypothetical protein HanXRQr2_Chr10g0419471 [Helianthus annuus]|uniref:Uncharacterized protein n=1 Tax=Helianthus annuus TaxID=4232 RepID=A0A9K3N2I5_HELAN|nr:hypothetical protein HanXRQr2_Chr10g0419471 [Helianthus annuus]KAJ0882088.1 hypothetical protein HanPSC8_Chr10g0405621 [Helianthus annuus]
MVSPRLTVSSIRDPFPNLSSRVIFKKTPYAKRCTCTKRRLDVGWALVNKKRISVVYLL